VVAGVEGQDEKLYALELGVSGVDERLQLAAADAPLQVKAVQWSPDGAYLAYVTEHLETGEQSAHLADFRQADILPQRIPIPVQAEQSLTLNGWSGSDAVLVGEYIRGWDDSNEYWLPADAPGWSSPWCALMGPVRAYCT
jgi:hypothetical protein